MNKHYQMSDNIMAGKPYLRKEDDQLTLYFAPGTVQSQMAVDDPDKLLLGYTQTLMAFLLFVPQPRCITMIGLGGGSLPKYCHRMLPAAVMDVVEINPHVIAMRNEFLIPQDDDRLRVHCGDGAEYIQALDNCADVIIVDGFDIEGQAPSLCTEAFYNHCYDALTLNGVMAVNLTDNHKHHASYISRVRRCFADAVLVVKSEDECNNVLFAVKGSPSVFAEKPLLHKAQLLEQQHPALPFKKIVERMTTNRHNSLLMG